MVVVLCGLVWGGYACSVLINRRARPKSRPLRAEYYLYSALEKRIRDELEENFAWWDRQYSELMHQVHTEKVYVGKIKYTDEITMMTSYTYPMPRPFYYEGCDCASCDKTRIRHG